MSENLFTNAQKELERMESILQARLKKYAVSINKDKIPPVNGKDAREVYTASISFTRHDGTTGFQAFDGDSFPDLFSKISDKI